jgi:hypothetical protein
MKVVHSIFSVSNNAARVSFLTREGTFAYAGVGYRYMLRPTTSSAIGTLRISKDLLDRFIKAYWPKTQRPKMQDLELLSQGFGWYKVCSLTEVGAASVHRFFMYLNRWVLAQQEKMEKLAQAMDDAVKPLTRPTLRKYGLVVERVGQTTRVVDVLDLGVKRLVTPVVKSLAPEHLQKFVRAMAAKFGH